MALIFDNKKTRLPKGKRRDDRYAAAIPLCFALASRQKASVGVRHPCDITVTTGKIYSHRHTPGIQSATCKGNSPIPRCCLAPSDNSLLPGRSATTSCSNVITSIISYIAKSVKRLFHFLSRLPRRKHKKSARDKPLPIFMAFLFHDLTNAIRLRDQLAVFTLQKQQIT